MFCSPIINHLSTGEKPSIEPVGVTDVRTALGLYERMSCQVVSGTPTPRITWRGPAGVLWTNGGPDLDIFSVSASDGGLYTCSASNALGEATASFNLIVSGER